MDFLICFLHGPHAQDFEQEISIILSLNHHRVLLGTAERDESEKGKSLTSNEYVPALYLPFY